MFECTHCHQTKPADAFYVSKGKRQRQCKECFRVKYYEPRAEEIKAKVAAWKTERHGRSPVTFLCKWCGAEVTRTVGRNGRSDFCSRTCKERSRREAERIERLASKPTDRRCAWCGVDMPQSMRADAHFCSARCNEKAHSTARNWRRRAGKAAPMRPRKNPLPSFIEIAERDNWRCQLCGGPVNKRRTHPDPLAGSLDHILPIARGGSESDPANVQLAHFRCNWSKRDRPANDRLRLLG